MADAPYSAVLFVHIMAAMGLFMSVALTLAGYLGARSSRTLREVRLWLSLASRADHALPVVALAQLASGLWLVHDRWRWGTAWIDVALGWFLATLILGPLLNGRPLAALARQVAEGHDGPVPEALAAKLRSRRLGASLLGLTGSTAGMLWLMVTKPGLAGAVAAVAIGAAVGLAAARLLPARGAGAVR
jgi:hypothetical protein